MNISDNKNDRNCCAVHALEHAGGFNFDEAQAIFAALGRKLNRGTPIPIIERALKLTLSTKRTNEFLGRTVRSVIADLPTSGIFILHVRGHIFTYKDGVVEDWVESDSRRRIVDAWYISAKKNNAKIGKTIARGRKILSSSS